VKERSYSPIFPQWERNNQEVYLVWDEDFCGEGLQEANFHKRMDLPPRGG
jgi:hypothetical protein